MDKNFKELEHLLIGSNLKFIELNSRMNYALIGHLYRNDEVIALIYPNTFYVCSVNLSINENVLRIIELIREDYTELTRDDKGKIITVEIGK